jgi:pimeloyl-ACP methyl ester carboxylesterase
MPRLKVGNVELQVRSEGDGPAVLLLHGFPDSSAVWRQVTPSLVAEGFRTICPDLRGFGESDAPVGKANYAIARLAEDAIGILDALGVQEAHLVGHDWGSALGWYLAGTRPERFRSFTALSVGHPGAYAAGGFSQLRKGWYLFAFLIPGLAERTLPRGNWRALRSATHHHHELEAWIASLSRPGRLTAAMNLYRANVLHPASHPKLTIPVLGVWSDRDEALTERQMLESARFVKGPWSYQRIDGASHWIPLDAPERLSEVLLSFFRSVEV